MSRFKIAFAQPEVTLESFSDDGNLKHEIKGLIHALESEFDDITRTTDTVENLISLSEVTGEIGEQPTDNERKLINLAGQFAVTGTEANPEDVVPSTESFKTFQNQLAERIVIANESISESLTRIWEGFKNVLKKIRLAFTSSDKELKILAAEIKKLGSKKKRDSITINLKQSHPGKYLDSMSSYSDGLVKTTEYSGKFFSELIKRGNSFVTESTSLLGNLKRNKGDEETLINETFDQFQSLFGTSFAAAVKLSNKSDEGTVIRHSSEPLFGGFRLVIEVPKEEKGVDVPYANKLSQMKRFAVDTEVDERNLEDGNPNFTVTYSELEKLCATVIAENRKLADNVDGFERLYSKMSDLIHEQTSINFNSNGSLNVRSVIAAAMSAAKGSNKLTKINDIVGRYVVNALDSFYEAEIALDSARSLVKKATLNTTWLKEA